MCRMIRQLVLSVVIALPWAVQLRADDVLTPIDLRHVKLGGELGRRIDVTIQNNLLVLDAEGDFLEPFRQKALEGGYIGLGKLIDATVKFAAYSQDPRVLVLKKHLVEETMKTQEPDGYIGIIKPGQRLHGLWDVHETGYVIWGLLADYEYFDSQTSLHAAQRAADYIVEGWSQIPDDWGQQTGVATNVAVTGLERAMLKLSRLTGDRKYLDFVIRQRALPAWDKGIVIGRRPLIEGHIYAYVSRCLAQLELYRMQPDGQLLQQTDRALQTLLQNDGCLVTGAAGQCEIWTKDQDGRGDLGETCATAYQLRLYDSMLRLTGESKYGDAMERTIYNTLFAAQSPDGRQLRYFSPVEGPRVYWEGDTYCCPCNYRRIIAELPMMAYYRHPQGVTVNLYGPGDVQTWVGSDVPVTLRQETTYPNAGTIQIRVEPEREVSFSLDLRIPSWTSGAVVEVNGQKIDRPLVPGTYCRITRSWKPGDQVRLDLPLSWRLVRGRQRQAGRVVVMRGPLVFSLNPVQLPELAKLDAADLGYITLDPSTLAEPIASDEVRPDGIACRLKAWKPGFSLAAEGDLDLVLTEFPDPNARVTYFRLRDDSLAVDDELFGDTTTESARQ